MASKQMKAGTVRREGNEQQREITMHGGRRRPRPRTAVASKLGLFSTSTNFNHQGGFLRSLLLSSHFKPQREGLKCDGTEKL